MISGVTAPVPVGTSGNIVLPLVLMPCILQAVSAVNLTTGYTGGGIYLGGEQFKRYTRAEELNEDDLAAAVALAGPFGSLLQPLTWAGLLLVERPFLTLFALFRGCAGGDVLRLIVHHVPLALLRATGGYL